MLKYKHLRLAGTALFKGKMETSKCERNKKIGKPLFYNPPCSNCCKQPNQQLLKLF